LNPITF